MRVKPEDFVAEVHDEASFIEFIRVLAQDKRAEDEIEEKTPSSPYASGALGWEHGNIGSYLDAVASCAAAQKRISGGMALGENPWRVCAEIMLNGKHYE